MFKVHLVFALLIGSLAPSVVYAEASNEKSRTVKGFVQTRPGGPAEEAEIPVHEAPVDLPVVSPDEANLKEDDLVLGVVVDGRAIAFPIRFLAMFEIVNQRIGENLLAPSW